jgi:hypothetical protein
MKNFLEFINENVENGEIVFEASTKGGKYSIIITKKKNIHGEYYDIDELKNGRTTGGGSRNTLEEIRFWVADTIVGSKNIDGINYIIKTDKLDVSDEVKDIQDVYDTMKSSQFRGYLSTLSEEEIKNMEIEAKETYKDNKFKAAFLRKKFFVDKFKNFLKEEKEATK